MNKCENNIKEIRIAWPIPNQNVICMQAETKLTLSDSNNKYHECTCSLMSAPRFKSKLTHSMWPFEAACFSAVPPIWMVYRHAAVAHCPKRTQAHMVKMPLTHEVEMKEEMFRNIREEHTLKVALSYTMLQSFTTKCVEHVHHPRPTRKPRAPEAVAHTQCALRARPTAAASFRSAYCRTSPRPLSYRLPPPFLSASAPRAAENTEETEFKQRQVKLPRIFEEHNKSKALRRE